ncbi:MAG: hypothetical protein WCT04_18705 [Planctomycetota bacterium]
MKLATLLGLALPFILLVCGCARAEDVVTLDDGTVMKGKFIKEEAGNIILQQTGGETSVIAKSRVKRMEITTGPMIVDPLAKVPAKENVKESEKENAVKPAIGNRNNSPRNLNPAWANPRIAEMDDLGSPELAKRKAALEKVKASKDEYTLVLLAMLNPKMKTSEYTRIGILRAMIDLAPLSDEAARTIAYSAMYDPYPEAKREACRTIRYLVDDRAIRELVKYAATEANATLKQAAAAALHEIDDNRIYASLVAAVPQPQVSGNFGEPTGLDKPKYTLPSGPGGLNMPIFLPSQPIMGVASDYGGPIVDFLRQLARKDMGNYPYAWSVWYREKIGEIGKEERDAYRDKRGIRDRSNAP